MTEEEAVVDLLRGMRADGLWGPGERFWVQVRAYTPEGMLLRFFNIERAQKVDRLYTREP